VGAAAIEKAAEKYAENKDVELTLILKDHIELQI
jgi:hypothetical protein